jgi:hypothetical protein
MEINFMEVNIITIVSAVITSVSAMAIGAMLALYKHMKKK